MPGVNEGDSVGQREKLELRRAVHRCSDANSQADKGAMAMPRANKGDMGSVIWHTNKCQVFHLRRMNPFLVLLHLLA